VPSPRQPEIQRPARAVVGTSTPAAAGASARRPAGRPFGGKATPLRCRCQLCQSPGQLPFTNVLPAKPGYSVSSVVPTVASSAAASDPVVPVLTARSRWRWPIYSAPRIDHCRWKGGTLRPHQSTTLNDISNNISWNHRVGHFKRSKWAARSCQTQERSVIVGEAPRSS
jgi:hypothetical protein